MVKLLKRHQSDFDVIGGSKSRIIWMLNKKTTFDPKNNLH